MPCWPKCTSWAPWYLGTRVGEAAHPGPQPAYHDEHYRDEVYYLNGYNESSDRNGLIQPVSRNIHGLRHNLPILLKSRIPIHTLQETDVPESMVELLKAQATAAGYFLEFGAPVALDKLGNIGRRVAILSKYKLFPTKDFDDPHVALLSASGRWLECRIPLQDGNSYMFAASGYGISGASSSSFEKI